jgi:lambda repressor-like predicted transcriptional regulator
VSTTELDEFLLQQCKDKGLSLRSLSIQAGLSPSTLHNIIKRKYQPTVFSLNRLADHLKVKRQYLWQLAGFIDDMRYNDDTEFGDPRLKFLFARVDKLSETAKTLTIEILESVIKYFPDDTSTTRSTSDK